MELGFYPDMTEEDYHTQKLLDEPALSYSIAKLLVTKTPAHAKYAHPILGGSNGVRESTAAMDRGSLAHAMILGKGKDIVILPEQFTDFRKKEAKEIADKAASEGKLAVLQSAVDECSDLVAAFISQLKGTEFECFFDKEAESEVAFFWRDAETGILMQGKMDKFHRSKAFIFDPKITTDASTKAFDRKALDMSYHIQSSFYRNGVQTLLPELAGRVRFVFLVIEDKPPYALNAIEYTGMGDALADFDARAAINTWAECLKSNKWPGYIRDGQGNWMDGPPWALREKQLL